MNKLKSGDKVKVIAGKESGKEGVIARVIRSQKNGKSVLKVVITGLNISKKSQKPNPQLGIAGGITLIEKPIDMSNVMLIDPKMNVPTRVGFKVDSKTGKKVRFAKKSGEILNN